MDSEGVIVTNVTDYQAAVELAGREYRRRYHQPPAVVALPRSVDPAALKLWTLTISDKPAPPGTVMMFGRDGRRRPDTTGASLPA